MMDGGGGGAAPPASNVLAASTAAPVAAGGGVGQQGGGGSGNGQKGVATGAGAGTIPAKPLLAKQQRTLRDCWRIRS